MGGPIAAGSEGAHIENVLIRGFTPGTCCLTVTQAYGPVPNESRQERIREKFHEFSVNTVYDTARMMAQYDCRTSVSLLRISIVPPRDRMVWFLVTSF